MPWEQVLEKSSQRLLNGRDQRRWRNKVSMTGYSDPEIEPDSALARRARADRRFVAAMLEVREGTSTIVTYTGVTYTAQSWAARDPDVPAQIFANAAH